MFVEHSEIFKIPEASQNKYPSCIINKVEVGMHDLESLAPGKMVNIVMTTALLKYVCMETKLLIV